MKVVVIGATGSIGSELVGRLRELGEAALRAKLAQERLIAASGLPSTIGHTTQCYELPERIADASTEGDGPAEVVASR